MTSVVKTLHEKELISPPKFLKHNVQFECVMGSMAYGVASDSSDLDIYGFAIPPKHFIFPHINGHIEGFGKKPQGFDQWQQHHIHDPSARGGKGQDYDFSIYGIVKYFNLCMENNPNMVDAMFVPQNSILHITQVGQMVRENRKLFLHKGCWHKFKGYAYSQIHKMKSKVSEVATVRCFEKDHGVPHDTTFDELKTEMASRGL
jgi:predicted nucleotidyltransferase